MNEYTKHVLKRNITAFLMACGMILLAVISILLIIWAAVLLQAYLPYITTLVIFISFAFVLSLPIRDYLKDKDSAREYQRLKDEERKRNGWKPN
jgi:membrane protein implicated in regulation of membrane protease activity